MMLTRLSCLLVAAGALTTLSAVSATARDVVVREDGMTKVDAPTTKVRVDERNGDTRVKVRAPYASVDVDTARGQVRVRAPYYNGNIRW